MSWPPKLPERYVMWPRPERALVGKGSFGEVWRAKDEHQGVLVALKILRARDARVQTRMEREAALAAKVVHPNVIALYDMGRTPEGLPYLAFPMASDGNLRRILGDPPPWPELLELLGDLLQALAALHSRGFLHLDVKLDNVLLHRAGARRRNVWLADLGVAIALYSDEDEERLIAGTVGYMPAEQLAGQHHLWGPSTDLFAFGALAYRLLCGEFPFPQKEPIEAHAARYRPAMKLPVIDDYVVPPGIDEVLLPLLHPSPRGRYDRAADVWRALQALPPVESGGRGVGIDVDPMEIGSAFLPPPGSNETSGAPSGMWPSTSSRSHLGGTLYPTADRSAQIQLTPLDVPPWNRPTPKTPPRSMPRPEFPKRLSNTEALLIHREIPLIGRDRELDLLWQAGRWVWKKQRPATIHVSGARGIGRTRLVQEYTRAVEESGMGEGAWLMFARREGPTTGLRGALRRIIPPQRDHSLFKNEVATLLARDRGAEIEECLDDAKTLCDWLVPQADEDPPDQERVIELAAEYLALRAWRGMGYLWVDDAHLAGTDEPVWALIERLYQVNAPVLVVLTTVQAEPQPGVSRHVERHQKRVHHIGLEALEEAAAAALVRAFLSVDRDLAWQIGAQTGGNPKYTREILIHWVRAEILLPEGGGEGAPPRWVKAKGAPPFPKDRTAFAQQRLSHALAHDPSRLSALLALAEADEGAPERVLSRVAGEMLDHLVVDGLVEIEQGRPKLVPPELSEAVRAWPREQDVDREVHRALAQAWKAEGSGPEVMARVGRHLALAGAYEAAREPLVEALKHLRHSLPVPQLLEWARLVRDVCAAVGQQGTPHWTLGALSLGDALWRYGHTDAGRAEVEGVLQAGHLYPGDAVRTCTVLVAFHSAEGAPDLARPLLEQARTKLGELPPPFHAMVAAAQAQLHLSCLELEDALVHARQGLDSSPHPDTQLLCHLVCADILARRRPKEGFEAVKAANELARTNRDLPGEARSLAIAARAEAVRAKEDGALVRLRGLVDNLAAAGENRACAETWIGIGDAHRIRGETEQAQLAYGEASHWLGDSRRLANDVATGLALLALEQQQAIQVEDSITVIGPLINQAGAVMQGAIVDPPTDDTVEQAVLCGTDGLFVLRTLVELYRKNGNETAAGQLASAIALATERSHTDGSLADGMLERFA